jgi:cytochrome c oxidase subunit III
MVYNGQQNSTRIPTKKILLWLAMVSMIMLFAGLTSAYIVRQAEGNWLEFDMPRTFSISTAVLLISSISMNRAVSFGRQGNMRKLRNALGITLILGLLFVLLQLVGWNELVKQGIFMGGSTANPSGSFLYVLTGLHLAHLAGGLFYLAYVLLISIRNARMFTARNLLSVELCSTFWHFLDGLWIYLFLFLLFAR